MRPSIVINAMYEPIPGWVEGINASILSIKAGAMTGLVRSLYIGKKFEPHGKLEVDN
jgi:hypothetical protein